MRVGSDTLDNLPGGRPATLSLLELRTGLGQEITYGDDALSSAW